MLKRVDILPHRGPLRCKIVDTDVPRVDSCGWGTATMWARRMPERGWECWYRRWMRPKLPCISHGVEWQRGLDVSGHYYIRYCHVLTVDGEQGYDSLGDAVIVVGWDRLAPDLGTRFREFGVTWRRLFYVRRTNVDGLTAEPDKWCVSPRTLTPTNFVRPDKDYCTKAVERIEAFLDMWWHYDRGHQQIDGKWMTLAELAKFNNEQQRIADEERRRFSHRG